MARVLLVLVTVAGLGLTAACGAGGSTANPRTPATVTVTAKPVPGGHLTFAPLDPTNTPSVVQPTPSPPRPTPRAPGPAPTDLSRDDMPGFTTPSGNIGCVFDRSGLAHVRCDRLEMNTVPGGKPADCQFDWGHSVELYAGTRGALACTGDSVMGLPGETDGSRDLPYGDSVRYLGILCTSTEQGLICSTSGGHGFLLSRETIKVH